jgi:hypothetical protein
MTDVSNLDTAQRGHHPHSPSSLQSSEACPKFQNEQRESEASKVGTLQHKAAETRDLELLDGDEELVNAVMKCLRYEDDIIEAAKNRDGVPPDVYKEVYLPVGDDIVKDENGRDWLGITGGYPDVIIAGVKVADILDWKYGKVPVTKTRHNLQGMAYALALLQHNEHLEAVTVHFYAPYQGFSPAQHWQDYVHTFRREDMAAMELRIRTTVARKLDPASQPRPAMDLCIWCARKGSCEALHQLVLKPASKHEDFVQPTEVHHYKLSKAEQVKAAFRWANQVEPIIKAIKKRATDMVLTENLDLGEDMKLVRRQTRSVRDAKLLVEIAMKHGLTEDEVWKIMGLPISIVEKLIKEKAPKGKGAAAVREFSTECNESGVTTLGEPIHFLQEAKSPAEKAKPVIEVIADAKSIE